MQLEDYYGPGFAQHKARFKRVAKSWRESTNKYRKKSIKEKYGDAPFVHNERTNVGFFAGAHWENGAYALEEYYTERKKRTIQYRGRVDLWIEYDKASYMVEAKQIIAKLDEDLSRVVAKIDKKLSRACDDLGGIESDYGATRLAAVFVVVKILKNRDHEIESSTTNLINCLKDEKKGLPMH